jgi:hypothetical protein
VSQARLIQDCDAVTYHADTFGPVPSLSASIAHVLDSRSPQHAFSQHPRLGGAPRRVSDTMDRGTLAHRLLLDAGPEVVVVAADDWRTKAAKEERDEARSRGAVPVLVEDYDAASEVADMLRQRFADLGIVLDGKSEVVALWTEVADDGTEVQCKGMIDHLKTPIFYDLKSTRDAHPNACVRSIDTYGYAIQHAAYSSGLAKIRPEFAGRIDGVFVFFELELPFAVFPTRLSGQFRELGARRWRRAVNAWARCLREDRWPGYAEEIVTSEPTPWAMKAELERGLGEMGRSASAAEDFLFGEG